MKIHYKYLLFILSLMIISFFHIFYGKNFSFITDRFILLHFRLPRYIFAFIAGGVLAISGALMQGLLQNPLADGYLVGIAGGAILGNTIASILFPGNLLLSVIISFIFGYIMFVIVLLISSLSSNNSRYSMIISGIMISSFSSAIVTILYIVSKKTSIELFYTIMGTLNIVFLQKYIVLYIVSIVLIIIGIIYIILHSKEMDIIASSYDIAYTSGIEVKKIANIFFIIAAFIVSVIIAFTGIIGYIGIVVPNIIKRIVPSKYIHIYILSLLGGATLLLFSDFIVKSFTNFEIPVGVVTSIIGIPFFIFLLRGNRE